MGLFECPMNGSHYPNVLADVGKLTSVSDVGFGALLSFLHRVELELCLVTTSNEANV